MAIGLSYDPEKNLGLRPWSLKEIISGRDEIEDDADEEEDEE